MMSASVLADCWARPAGVLLAQGFSGQHEAPTTVGGVKRCRCSNFEGLGSDAQTVL
jgi:hypothetical protein